MIKFGTDGWRAIISDEFTFDNVRKIAQAIASYVDKGLVVVGYDARFLADKFAEEVVKVLLANGISCLLTERDTPTPTVAWLVKTKKARGAIMLTASHNPPEYLGIKFIPDYAGPADEEITKEIENKILTPSLTSFVTPLSSDPIGGEGNEFSAKGGKERGEVKRFDPQGNYLKYLQTFIDAKIIKNAKLKIAIDPMYGSGRGYLDKLLQGLDCETFCMHEYRNVLFGGRNPEPSNENLEELKALVTSEKADLGLANDGDADRFGLVDEKGKFLDANQVLSLLALYLIEDRKLPGAIVRSVATTHCLDKIGKMFNRKVYECPVGFKHIAKIMLREKVALGGEESGGASILGHIPEKDGLLVCLLAVEMIARKKKPLSEIWEELVEKVGNFIDARLKIEIDEISKKKIMSELESNPPTEISGIKVSEINKLDGVKLILEDKSWLLVRPSGTEPIIRIYIESDSRNKVERMLEFCYNKFGAKQ